MVETMGENLDYLQKSLQKRYPNTKFELYNYGVGGDNVEMGLNRLNSNFKRGSRNYPSLMGLKPDIIIVGSFSYNPFEPQNPEKHKALLKELAHRLRNTDARVYILIEIAPRSANFGHGAGGVNWPEDLAKAHAEKIIGQLIDSINVANELSVGLIDVFSKSQVFGGNFGNPFFISRYDGIHPSARGHKFTADMISATIGLP